MIINPYLVYFGLQKQQFCPRCFNKTSEKNLKFKPFGDKEPEIYNTSSISENSVLKWHCPYCGHSLNKEALFCGSCGKKFEIKH